jgi:hypothetical protein
MRTLLDQGETIFFISWTHGASSFGDRYQKEILSQQLIYLEIKSSLIVKIPYMKDIAPLFLDMNNLSRGIKMSQSHLIFDNVRSLVNSEEPERALSTLIDFSKMAQTSFKSSHFIMTSFMDSKNDNIAARIAQVLAGRNV